jgi:lipopolysaccharide export system protein LptA
MGRLTSINALGLAMITALALGLTAGAAAQDAASTGSAGSTSAASSEAKSKTELALDTNMQKDFGKLPTYIKADSLTLKSQERYFTYTGNVEVRHGDMTMTSDTLEGTYSEKNEIQQLTAKSNVVITKGDNIRASGQKALYEAGPAMVTLTEGPELQQNQSILTADAIKIFLKENRSVAEGTVRLKLVKKEGDQKPEGLLGIK